MKRVIIYHLMISSVVEIRVLFAHFSFSDRWLVLLVFYLLALLYSACVLLFFSFLFLFFSDAAVNALTNELGQLKLTVEGLEKERNFYFGKLREIEILCQAESETQAAELADFKQQVLNILYQTDENSEFQVPQEEEAAAPEQTEAEQGLLDNNEIQE